MKSSTSWPADSTADLMTADVVVGGGAALALHGAVDDPAIGGAGVVRAGDREVAEAVVDGVEVVELAVVPLGHGVEHGDGLFRVGRAGGNAGGAGVEVGLVAPLPELAIAVHVVLQLHLAIDHLDHALLHQGIGAGLVAVGAGLPDGIHVAGVGQPPGVGGQNAVCAALHVYVSLLMQYAAARGLCASPSFEALRQAQGERAAVHAPRGATCALAAGVG